MSKGMRREKALKNKAYLAIRDAAMESLRDRGVFSKSEVLERSGYEGFEDDDIRWDIIRWMIEEMIGSELICLSESYFKRHAKRDEYAIPGKYIAVGNGKRTCGFALASTENGHLFRKKLEIKEEVANGFVKSVQKTRNTGALLGLVPPTKALPSSSEDGKDAA